MQHTWVAVHAMIGHATGAAAGPASTFPVPPSAVAPGPPLAPVLLPPDPDGAGPPLELLLPPPAAPPLELLGAAAPLPVELLLADEPPAEAGCCPPPEEEEAGVPDEGTAVPPVALAPAPASVEFALLASSSGVAGEPGPLSLHAAKRERVDAKLKANCVRLTIRSYLLPASPSLTRHCIHNA
ncbi:MAG: hypothetical protein JOZ69_07630, partial [Myxococcales bacterium]|nr:hypothetical protein [Myxococcales bacterium]